MHCANKCIDNPRFYCRSGWDREFSSENRRELVPIYAWTNSACTIKYRPGKGLFITCLNSHSGDFYNASMNFGGDGTPICQGATTKDPAVNCLMQRALQEVIQLQAAEGEETNG